MPTPQKHLTGLSFHLMLAAWEWTSLRGALLNVSAASPFSKLPYSLPPALGKWLEKLQDPLLAAAVKTEADSRILELLRGIHHYQLQAAEPLGTKHTVVREIGHSRLLHYPALARAKRKTIFLVPSLINRFHVLDLNEKLSFVRFLQLQGYACYILDWGNPGVNDADKNSEYYITEVLLPLLAWTKKQNPQYKMVLTGYCMGGVMSLAAAQLKPKLIDALALLATPWNFHSADFFRVPLDDEEQEKLQKMLAEKPLLSAEAVQMLFYASNPFVFHDKFRRFAEANVNSPSVRDFMAIEQWVNDGVPMTRALAQECLIGWVQKNILAKGEWKISGNIISPQTLKMPTFIAAPQDDRIVPPGCALPLAALMPHARLLAPVSGHVGMVVGTRRKAALWHPFAAWAEHAA